MWQHFARYCSFARNSPVNDTSDHDQVRDSLRGRASLETVDFDVTAGFGDETTTDDAEFIDLTAADPAAASDAEVVEVTTTVPERPAAPSAAPSVSAPAAAGGGNLALIGAIVAALVAAVLWYVLR